MRARMRSSRCARALRSNWLSKECRSADDVLGAEEVAAPGEEPAGEVVRRRPAAGGYSPARANRFRRRMSAKYQRTGPRAASTSAWPIINSRPSRSGRSASRPTRAATRFTVLQDYGRRHGSHAGSDSRCRVGRGARLHRLRPNNYGASSNSPTVLGESSKSSQIQTLRDIGHRQQFRDAVEIRCEER